MRRGASGGCRGQTGSTWILVSERRSVRWGEVEKSRAVCHAVPLPAIPLSSSPPPSPLSPPCQEWHQSPLRESLQGRNSQKPANYFSVHTRTYAYRHIHVSYVSQWDHPRYMPPCSLLTQTQPPRPPHLQHTYSVCVIEAVG